MNFAFSTPTVTSNAPSLVHAPGSPLEEVMKAVARMAPTDSTVLLTGETGTGKEVVARYVHDNSPRSRRHFVPVNCGAIPETLLESELFGHVRGAFTGAVANRKGRVAVAEGGTLFLDEIGEMPLALQVKLLRLLQERTYEPVGSAESVTANFRLIAATNRNLAHEVEAGRFRRDLYYRLMVCPVELPPLRARKADVMTLFHHFWRQRGETRPLEAAAVRAIELHPWPGNVRELENLVERVSVCTEGPVIRVIDLPASVRQAAMSVREFESPTLQLVVTEPSPSAAPNTDDAQNTLGNGFEPLVSQPAPVQVPSPEALLAEAQSPRLPIDLPALLRSLEDAYIAVALEQAKGNRKAAADLLGLQRTTLVEKLRRRAKESQAA
jgi:sigma-54 specific flagellar transcriptional regulator A